MWGLHWAIAEETRFAQLKLFLIYSNIWTHKEGFHSIFSICIIFFLFFRDQQDFVRIQHFDSYDVVMK